MSEFWIVSVSDKAYGPYSTQQMETFAAEGRLAPASLIARAGETDFRAAGAEPVFSDLFQPSKMNPSDRAERAHADKPAAPHAFGRSDADAQGERGRFVIIADMKSRSIQGLEDEIFKMGPAHSMMPQVWLLVTDLSVNSVRNILIQQLGKLDLLFVVDTTHDKAAWFNFGPETDARVRKLWVKDPVAAHQAYG